MERNTSASKLCVPSKLLHDLETFEKNLPLPSAKKWDDSLYQNWNVDAKAAKTSRRFFAGVPLTQCLGPMMRRRDIRGGWQVLRSLTPYSTFFTCTYLVSRRNDACYSTVAPAPDISSFRAPECCSMPFSVSLGERY